MGPGLLQIFSDQRYEVNLKPLVHPGACLARGLILQESIFPSATKTGFRCKKKRHRAFEPRRVQVQHVWSALAGRSKCQLKVSPGELRGFATHRKKRVQPPPKKRKNAGELRFVVGAKIASTSNASFHAWREV